MGPRTRIGVERGWIGGRSRVLVRTGTGSDKITSSGTLAPMVPAAGGGSVRQVR